MAATVTITGDRELLARVGPILESAREEFVCAARDLGTWAHLGRRPAPPGAARGPGDVRVPDGIRRRDVQKPEGARGPGDVRVRKLYGPGAAAGEGDRRHLAGLVGRGARVRIAAAPLPHETIIVDRRFAIIASAGARDREYTVTGESSLVGGVCALFDAAWESAADLTAALRGGRARLDPEAHAVLRALGSGATDEAAARRLGMSLRTYRRRVAALLDALDAGSRFQAGVRAGELGLGG